MLPYLEKVIAPYPGLYAGALNATTYILKDRRSGGGNVTLKAKMEAVWPQDKERLGHLQQEQTVPLSIQIASRPADFLILHFWPLEL